VPILSNLTTFHIKNASFSAGISVISVYDKINFVVLPVQQEQVLLRLVAVLPVQQYRLL
jgi:hypothetical protein